MFCSLFIPSCSVLPLVCEAFKNVAHADGSSALHVQPVKSERQPAQRTAAAVCPARPPGCASRAQLMGISKAAAAWNGAWFIFPGPL